jgi:hypothetical protein
MARKCSTYQHIKRAEIDRRPASGEPGRQVAQDYGLNPSSVHRHRVKCLGLASSNRIMKEMARGTAAFACLPSWTDLSGHYFDLQTRLAPREGRLSPRLRKSQTRLRRSDEAGVARRDGSQPT